MAELKNNPDGSMSIYRELDSLSILTVGGPTNPTPGTGQTHMGANVAKVPLFATTSATSMTGTVLAWGGFAEDRLISEFLVNITGTASTSLNFGTATDAVTSSTNLITALTVAATGLFDNITDKGASGKSRQKLTAGSYITGTPDTTCGTLAGAAYIYYTKA